MMENLIKTEHDNEFFFLVSLFGRKQIFSLEDILFL